MKVALRLGFVAALVLGLAVGRRRAEPPAAARGADGSRAR